MTECVYSTYYSERWNGVIINTGGNNMTSFSGYLIKYNSINKIFELYEFIFHGTLRPLTLKRLDGYTIFCNEKDRDEIIVARELDNEEYFSYDLEDFWDCYMERAPRELSRVVKKNDGTIAFKVYKPTKWVTIEK